MGLRYVAFLRGLNVGGHRVEMAELRGYFEELGLTNVESFIASGNIAFEADGGGDAALERRIEAKLEQELGYEVATFVRTSRELAEIAAHDPFVHEPKRPGDTRHVTFLKGPAPPAVLALSNDEDVLRGHGRELYWLRRGGLSQTTIPEKELRRAWKGTPSTARNLNTVQKLAAKYPPA